MGQTRFDAADATGRRELFADAVIAHRERESAFLTIEADSSAVEASTDSVEDDFDSSPDPSLGVPWVQVTGELLSLDCTEEELERLKTLCEEYPSFRIDDLVRPEEADGVHARVSARTDPSRIAQFVDSIFESVYGLGEEYRAWVVEV